jgi:hypothetical protein
MRVVFEQMTPNQMRQFLKFLYESMVSYTFESTQIDTIISAIRQDLVNPEWISTDSMGDVLAVLDTKEDLSLFVKMVRGFKDQSFDFPLRPTDHYIRYCGNEWLNAKGLTTKNNAIRFIENQIQQQNMKEIDGLIFTNTWMKEFLNDYRTCIYRKEIPNLVHRFFVE